MDYACYNIPPESQWLPVQDVRCITPHDTSPGLGLHGHQRGSQRTHDIFQGGLTNSHCHLIVTLKGRFVVCGP